ncbi:MAG: glycerol-3-phosphate 1-O-acyltransferase PlsY [Desulfobacteraceae bacterium]|uniref:Glycerol-3-phosphate acyltransferase n=1 Tax=Candidatus Desulfaltia bathyphila TaxID=2841697 RepID=A0A8J6N595_9BACT|nr:glycerol-3-phosphate 1-O-acyltransferase PlsY [Candidatus Desulfaltia bathyphila]
MFTFFGLSVFAYLFGSIPCGLILTKKFASIDIRQKGSKNIGAANVRRVAGTMLGAFTLAGDLLKGALPVCLVIYAIAGTDKLIGEIYLSIVALSAFLGHLYPVYMKFKEGGKGVTTAAGCFIIISPIACIVAILTFIVLIFLSRRVSAGSLSGAAVLPVAVWVTSHSIPLTACALITTIFIFFRHKDNIKRLLSGTEPVI